MYILAFFVYIRYESIVMLDPVGRTFRNSLPPHMIPRVWSDEDVAPTDVSVQNTFFLYEVTEH